MPQQLTTAVENNFTKGLLTEFTGLNFPENAATETSNCDYSIVGNVLRRLGIDLEEGYSSSNVSGNQAISTYKWNNAGGDSTTQLVVVQIGPTLRFYRSSSATASSPLSNQLLVSTVDISNFVSAGGTFNIEEECTYADGNGYLFVFNSTCDPFYCNYNAGTITATEITVKIRDFLGVPEDVLVNARPTTLTSVHKYNLNNQGWTSGNAWQAVTSSAAFVGAGGVKSFNVGLVSGITLGDTVYGYSLASSGGIFGSIPSGTVTFGGTVTAYANPTLTINITSVSNPSYPNVLDYTITQTNVGFINAWQAAEGNYPSNADVWWYFKNASNVFDPATTQPNISLSVGNAPQGHYIVEAFNQNRAAVSGISGITPIVATKRPSNGCWFQGRVWYTGVDASQQATGTAPFYSWSENIYFSQVNIGTAVNFGNCYQVNDPTSENLFDLLPTDGGVIQIQGSGKVYKLFPIQNGLLVFAANGVWFITGSQGIGFTANDYTITRLSSIESMSTTSFVDVQGLPYFWNEEGIYSVQPQQGGSLSVESITVSTIDTFYNQIPKQSKKYVRGAYHPINYVIQWVYRSENETGIEDRYTYDTILNYNTHNKAFFPYSIDTTSAEINSILYVQSPGGSTSPDPVFKYLCFITAGSTPGFSFAEEFDEDLVDWASTGTPVNYNSFFVTGYKIRGQAIRKFQVQYLQMFLSTDDVASGYEVQGIWNYANSGNSGKWTQKQTIINGLTRFNNIFRRHKIRGSGYALQFKVSSIDGMPFDFIGWAVVDTVNQGT